LSSADVIVALGKDKTIVELGSFADLHRAGGYVQELLESHAKAASHADTTPSPDRKEPETVKQSKVVAKTAEEAEDKRRQLGDLAVYSYYFGSIGAGFLIALIFFELLWAFFSTFPSES